MLYFRFIICIFAELRVQNPKMQIVAQKFNFKYLKIAIAIDFFDRKGPGTVCR
jgi:hypothetical protein